MQNPMQCSWYGKFHHIEHTNLGIFFRKNLTTDMSYLTLNTSKHIVQSTSVCRCLLSMGIRQP